MVRRFAAATICLALGGCQNLGIGQGEIGSALGGGFGAAAGGYLGSQIGTGFGQTAATIAGASLGALFGSAIGRKLAEGDLNLMGQAAQQTLETSPSGSATAWRNPDTGRAGSVVAGPAYERNGQPCRPIEQSISIDGQLERASGVACRRADGVWEVPPA